MTEVRTNPQFARIVGKAISVAFDDVTARDLLVAAADSDERSFTTVVESAGIDARRLRLTLSEWNVPASVRLPTDGKTFTPDAAAAIRSAHAALAPTEALLSALLGSIKHAADGGDRTAAAIQAFQLA